MNMNRIIKLQYKNLRDCFHENLVKPILGEGYYNLGMDVYTCDRMTTEDLKYEYDSLKKKIKFFKILSIILVVIIIIISILKFK